MAWAALIYALIALAFAYPALSGHFLVSRHSDQYITGYAFREFAASTLRATGHFPEWNPYLVGGVPFIDAMAGDIFYPTFLLRLIMPVDAAMTWGFIIHFFLAGLFTFGFLRAWGLGFLPSLVGGAAYMLGGPVASYPSPGHDGKLFVSALFPLVLWLELRGIRDGRAWAWGMLTLVLGLAVLSPHPQLFQYLLLAYGAFGLYLAFLDKTAGGLPRPVAIRRFALAMVAVAGGVLIGAVQFLPLKHYYAWSPRGGGGTQSGWEHATSYSMPPEELLNTYLPQFSGILDAYWGRNLIHFHSEYLGVAVMVLAGLAFGNAAARGRRGFLWFWTAALIVGVLWALGGYTPFYRLVYALIPGTRSFRAPSTMLYIVGFSLAMLAALGVERVLTRDVPLRYLAVWGGVAALFVILGVSGALTNFGEVVLRGSGLPSSYVDALSQRVEANAGAVTFGALRSLLFVAAALGVAWAAGTGRLEARHAGWALLAVVALDLWSIEREYWPFSPPASQLYATNAAVEYIKSHNQPARVLAWPVQPTEEPRDPFLHDPPGYNALMVHRVRMVLGSHGNELARYDQLVGIDRGYQPVLSPLVWRLLNVRYLLTNVAGVQEQIPGSRQAVGPVKSAAGSTLYLYELPGDNPPAWVTTAAVKAPDEAALATITDQRFDPRSAAIFDTAAAVPVAANLTAAPAPSAIAVQVTRYEPGHITARLASPAPAGSALVVSENFYPGWSATVNGKPATAARADLTLIGVPLAAGATEVDLTFRSSGYHTGKVITLIALAGAAAAAVAGLLIDRRGRG